MKRISILSALFIAGAISAYAQPKLEMDGNDAYDWGKVSPKDGRLTAVIKVKNSGNQELKIDNVKPGCGCTTPTLKKSVLAPGEVTDLEIGLNVGANVGPLTKQLNITSNDPAVPNKVYFLKATIERALQVTPNYIVFNEAFAGKEASQKITIHNSSAEDVTLSDFTSSGDVKVDATKPVVLKAGGDVTLGVSVKAAKAGALNFAISMKTTHKDFATLDISGYAAVKDTPDTPALNK